MVAQRPQHCSTEVQILKLIVLQAQLEKIVDLRHPMLVGCFSVQLHLGNQSLVPLDLEIFPEHGQLEFRVPGQTQREEADRIAIRAEPGKLHDVLRFWL